ncbi:hypothetical protein [Brucella intermedia]|uniref:hypothetical protein n=1 Tax=Brucella intermedia TaxID=94625 RepID=UPI00235E0B23|nr:hypothetical protein [Brucella intermedia]
MSDINLARPTFLSSGKNFDEILFGGACGGAAAVRCYLQTRRSMLVRDLGISSLAGGSASLLQALSVFDDALVLLSNLVEGSHDGQRIGTGTLTFAVQT